jgi:hypothetical protein
MDATLGKLSLLQFKLSLRSCKLHIALALGSSITTFYPVSMVTIAWSHRRAYMLHDLFQPASGAIGNSLRRVYCVESLQPGQCFGQSTHGIYAVISFGTEWLLLAYQFYFMTSSKEACAYCI